jgi:hypothetical protein
MRKILLKTRKINNTLVKCLLLILIIAISLPFTSCEKDPFPNFALTIGKNVTVTRTVAENFTKISLNDDVDLVLTQGTNYSISIEGGENILSGIETTIADSTLTIRNHNKFNWLHSYDKKIIAYVTLPHLVHMTYESIGTVSCTDTIREDSLYVNSNAGSGYIKLKVNIGTSHFSINSGSVDMDISGISGVNYIYSNAYGPFHCQNLKTIYTFITSNSTNDCYVNATYLLEYNILSLGNIYYSGNPQLVASSVTGAGKLIKLP